MTNNGNREMAAAGLRAVLHIDRKMDDGFMLFGSYNPKSGVVRDMGYPFEYT